MKSRKLKISSEKLGKEVTDLKQSLDWIHRKRSGKTGKEAWWKECGIREPMQ